MKFKLVHALAFGKRYKDMDRANEIFTEHALEEYEPNDGTGSTGCITVGGRSIRRQRLGRLTGIYYLKS